MPKSVARHYALIRVAAPQDEVDKLVSAIEALRGIHQVSLKIETTWSDKEMRGVPNGWRKLVFRGTERGVLGGKNLLAMSGLEELDVNADHDHARCIESARKMGVPASWAHRPETYLSM